MGEDVCEFTAQKKKKRPSVRASMSTRARTGVFVGKSTNAANAEKLIRERKRKEMLEKKKESWDDQLIFVLLAGMIYGVVAEKAKLTGHVRAQFALTHWQYAKVMAAAAAAGLFVTGLLSIAGSFAGRRLETTSKDFALGGVRRPALVLGAALCGMGMAVANADPALAWAQAGSGHLGAWATIAGGVAGALLFGLLEPQLQESVCAVPPSAELVKLKRLAGPARPFVEVALPISGVLALIAVGLETFYDWRVQLGVVPLLGEGPQLPSSILVIPAQLYMHMKAWLPAYGGAALGALQLLYVLVLYRTPGAARAYATLAAQATRLTERRGGDSGAASLAAALKARPCFVEQRALKIDNWLQVFFCLGLYGGGYVSSMMGEHDGQYAPALDADPAANFVGGMIMLFGARLCGGGPVAHGISGVTLLNADSFLAIGLMLAAAVATTAAVY
jgi:uncharacterized protein